MPAPTNTIAKTTAMGSRTRMHRRVRSTQKLPTRSVWLRGESAYERDGDGHADCGRGEVLYRQAGHLRDVAECALSGIALPVGIGNEADRGVPGLATRHLRYRVWVTEVVRQPQQCTQENDRHRAEGQHRSQVATPPLLGIGVDSAETVDHPLGPKMVRRRKHSGHVVTEW